MWQLCRLWSAKLRTSHENHNFRLLVPGESTPTRKSRGLVLTPGVQQLGQVASSRRTSHRKRAQPARKPRNRDVPVRLVPCALTPHRWASESDARARASLSC
jgi:hypothetical protein